MEYAKKQNKRKLHKNGSEKLTYSPKDNKKGSIIDYLQEVNMASQRSKFI